MRRALPLALILVTSAAFAVELDGPLIQGGLVVGRAVPGAEVRLDGRRVRVDGEGRFVMGFGRDAAPAAQLEIRTPDGAVERRELAIAQRTYEIQRIDGLPPAMVTPPPQVLERIKREAAQIAEVRKTDSDRADFLAGWTWPVDGPVTGVYGSQRILNGKPRQPHYGIDIAAALGTPVVAAADGVVALAESDLYFTGGTVILDHGHGLTAAYSHLQTVGVTVGQRMRRGEPVGTVGATGRVTGAHLDWRLNWFEVRLDPALVLPPKAQ